MSFDRVKKYFDQAGLADRISVFQESSATVAKAAEAVGCEEKQIAKSMVFLLDERAILVVAAGHVKIDNRKYRDFFKAKAKMMPADLVKEYIGHEPGGVCPFLVNPNAEIYLDISLKDNEIIYPAGGSGNSCIRLSIEELEDHSNYKEWVDVCKPI